MTKRNQKIIRDFSNCLQKATCKYCHGWRTEHYMMYQEDFIHNLWDARDWSNFRDEVMHPCRYLGLWKRETAIKVFYKEFLINGTEVSYEEFQQIFIRIYRTCLRARNRRMGIANTA